MKEQMQCRGLKDTEIKPMTE